MIVFDLDGTLTDDLHRRVYLHDPHGYDEYNKRCAYDKPNRPLLGILRALVEAREHVEIWSGRNESVRAETEKWFRAYAPWVLSRVRIVLRPRDNHDPSAALKEKWLDKANGNVTLAFDDLDSAVAMWRRRGVVCCQPSNNPEVS